ncbi:MAG: DUF488 domain-containing protein [Thalassospira sp.]|nr:DUF488 domain-containing protein [Thalassospira sp.]
MSSSIDAPILFTIGYAGHDRDSLLAALREHRITAVADIRTFKRSSYWTAFDSDDFGPWLRLQGIAYVFMGDLLGGKPQDERLYPGGQLDYRAMSQTPAFQQGMARLISGAARYRICLMCAEKDPLDCHRTLLIAPALKESGFDLRHILKDGRIETQHDTECRMVKMHGGDTPDLFANPAHDLRSVFDLALQKQVARIAPKAMNVIRKTEKKKK